MRNTVSKEGKEGWRRGWEDGGDRVGEVKGGECVK